MEVRGEVKGVPKHACEGSQVNNLKVGVVGTRVRKEEREKRTVKFYDRVRFYDFALDFISELWIYSLADSPPAGCRGSPGPSEWPGPPHLHSAAGRACRWNTRPPHLDKLLQWPPCRVDPVDLTSSVQTIANVKRGLLTAAAGAGAAAVSASRQSGFY